MRGLRYDRILAGTAVALILAAGGLAASGLTTNDAQSAPARGTPSRPAVQAVPAPTRPAPATTESTTPAPDVTGTAVTADPAADTAKDAKKETTPPADAAKAETTPAAATAGETVTPDPFAALDPADRPIAEKIRDLLAAKVDKIFASKKERAAVDAFYQNRNLAPLWLEKGVESKRAQEAAARIRAADTDGLDLADYKLPDLRGGLSPDALAESELKFTATVLTYARHVQAGRFSYSVVSKNIELPQLPPDTAEVLTKLADAPDAGKALDEFSPPQKNYQALKAKLAELRGKAGGGSGNEIASGPELKLTKVPTEDPRVPQLRQRLGLTGEPSDLRYDAKLVEAVKKYQRANELKVTGALDAQTIRELNGPPRDKQIDTIIVNMERWRWVPRDLGKTHVIVNLPDYTLRLVHDGALIWTTRIVVGKPAMPTPLLVETMKFITVNPTWNVPQSIVQNEYLPALQQDSTVLERMGLHVVNERDGTVRIYQPPGDNNALGRLRFNFPNRFDVYQHDTPDKYLFKEERRAYSHGCMRVQDPVKYAQLLLTIERPNEGYTEERIRKMFGRDEQDIQFPTPIPVNLTYQTAFVDDDGQLVIRPDIYGLDGRVLAAIKSERGVVEFVPKEQRDREYQASLPRRTPTRLPPSGPVGFFQALFGGGAASSIPNGPNSAGRSTSNRIR